MADVFDSEIRSKIMSKIRSKNTKPEKAVRSFLHSQGMRFRIHRKDLPGNPDIVLPKFNTVIFVQGCFWHHHRSPSCPHSKIPKSNKEFWIKKFSKNMNRDEMNVDRLLKLGWSVKVVWECEINVDSLVLLAQSIRQN